MPMGWKTKNRGKLSFFPDSLGTWMIVKFVLIVIYVVLATFVLRFAKGKMVRLVFWIGSFSE